MGRPILVVALDVPTLAAASHLVARLRHVTPWFKIGPALFTAAGPEAVRMAHAAGGRVFLDLKFHDIPQTVAGGVAAAAELGVALVTVHCAGGAAMMAAAADAARRSGVTLRVVGVTRLTSEPGRVGGWVVRAALEARASGLDGVVASARECARIKAAAGGGFLVVTPGIRPTGASAHDQARVATPRQAVRAGADFLVVGRPVTAAADPQEAAGAIRAQMDAEARRLRARSDRPAAPDQSP